MKEESHSFVPSIFPFFGCYLCWWRFLRLALRLYCLGIKWNWQDNQCISCPTATRSLSETSKCSTYNTSCMQLCISWMRQVRVPTSWRSLLFGTANPNQYVAKQSHIPAYGKRPYLHWYCPLMYWILMLLQHSVKILLAVQHSVKGTASWLVHIAK